MNDQQRAGRIALEESRERSKRIRVGMTGLGGILLIVGLASAMMSRLTADAATAPQTNVTQITGPSGAQPIQNESVTAEPLVELGVAPEAPQVAGPSTIAQ
jgi:hypothetical protein